MPPIYHFTDVSNLETILEAGALQCHRFAPTKVDIGNASIKSNRQVIDVDCGPGGKVCDYVPFYFAPNSPMLFSIKCGNVPGVDPNQRRIIYLVSSTETMYEAGLDCVFTNGNAAVYITDFDDHPAHLATHVDWRIMREKYWRNTLEDGDRVRRRMAEFLVHEEVPIELFTEIGVYDNEVRRALLEALEDVWSVPVIVRRGWYF